jgi:hypothetical protein
VIETLATTPKRYGFYEDIVTLQPSEAGFRCSGEFRE